MTGHLRGIVVFLVLTANTVLCVTPLMVLAAVKLLIPLPAFRQRVTRWLMTIGEMWVSGNAAVLGLGRSIRLEVSGAEDLDRNGWYLVISNHRSWLDIPVLQAVFNRRIPFLKFFIKRELIWFPFLGMAWWALDMPFMTRYSKSYLAKHPAKKGHDLEVTRAACDKFRDTPTSVINFVEGTRFSEEKRVSKGSPFRHLLLPRAGGIALALASMGRVFDAVLDVTIVYPQVGVQFWDLCCGDLEHVIVDIERRPIDAWMVDGDYVNDRVFRSAFHRRLKEIWQEKDAKIERLMAAAAQRG